MRVVVIGAGFAGLAAATRVAEDGHEVTLVDRRAEIGSAPRAIVDDETGEAPPTGRGMLLCRTRAARAFLARIGADTALDMIDPRGPRGSSRGASAIAGSLGVPPGFGLLTALAPEGALSMPARLVALRVAAAILTPGRLAPPAEEHETADAWLARLSQSPAARTAFWRPIALAALHADLADASARVLEASLRDALGADDAGLAGAGPPASFGAPAAALLAKHRATLRLGARVMSLVVRATGNAAAIAGVRLDGGEEIGADAVILAVSARAAYALIPEPTRSADRMFALMDRLRSTPVVAAHLWLDRAVSAPPFIPLTRSPWAWALPGGASSSRISLIAPAAPALLDRGDRELADLARADLARSLPAAASARLVRSRVTRDPRATLAHRAGAELDRPRGATSIDGLYLAGEHVRSTLPATLEIAARSGEDAARMVLAYDPPPPPRGFIPLSSLTKKRPRPI